MEKRLKRLNTGRYLTPCVQLRPRRDRCHSSQKKQQTRFTSISTPIPRTVIPPKKACTSVSLMKKQQYAKKSVKESCRAPSSARKVTGRTRLSSVSAARTDGSPRPAPHCLPPTASPPFRLHTLGVTPSRRHSLKYRSNSLTVRLTGSTTTPHWTPPGWASTAIRKVENLLSSSPHGTNGYGLLRRIRRHRLYGRPPVADSQRVPGPRAGCHSPSCRCTSQG